MCIGMMSFGNQYNISNIICSIEEFTGIIKEIHEKLYNTLSICGNDKMEFFYKALEVSLRNRNITYERKKNVPIYFENEIIGFEKIAFIINNDIVIFLRKSNELKCHSTKQKIRQIIKLANCSKGYVIKEEYLYKLCYSYDSSEDLNNINVCIKNNPVEVIKLE